MNSPLINHSQARISSLLLPPPNSTMNSSTPFTSVDESALLTEINRQKRILLSPAILYTILTMFIGIVGNPLAIYIYGFKWPNTTTRWFLLWLACVDLLNCIITMPTEIYFLASFYYSPNGTFCFITRFFTYLINNSTSVVFVAIAIDRYIRICHPHRSNMSIFGAKIACIMSLIIGAGVSWPAFFLYGRKEVRLPIRQGSVSGVMCSIRNDMDNTVYPYAFFIYLCCGVSACFLILCVLYVLIARVILKRRRAKDRRREQRIQDCLQREQATGDEREPATGTLSMATQEQPSGDVRCINLVDGCADLVPKRWSSRRLRPPKSTLMLFAITAVFVLSFLPFLIITIIRQHVGPSFYPSLSHVQEVMVNIFARSYLVNNCANPIVYGLCNSQFSAEVRKIFRMSLHRRNSSLSRKESNGSGIHISRTLQD